MQQLFLMKTAAKLTCPGKLQAIDSGIAILNKYIFAYLAVLER